MEFWVNNMFLLAFRKYATFFWLPWFLLRNMLSFQLFFPTGGCHFSHTVLKILFFVFIFPKFDYNEIWHEFFKIYLVLRFTQFFQIYKFMSFAKFGNFHIFFNTFLALLYYPLLLGRGGINGEIYYSLRWENSILKDTLIL